MPSLSIVSQLSDQRVELIVAHDQLIVRIGTRTNFRFIANFFRNDLHKYGDSTAWSKWDENIRFLEDGMRRSGFPCRADFQWVKARVEETLCEWVRAWD